MDTKWAVTEWARAMSGSVGFRDITQQNRHRYGKACRRWAAWIVASDAEVEALKAQLVAGWFAKSEAA